MTWHCDRTFIATSVILLDGLVPLCTYDKLKIKMNWMIDLSHLKNLDKGTLARLASLVRWFEIQILLENGRKLKTLTSFTDSSYYFKRINDSLEVNHKRQEDSLLFCTRQYFGRIRPKGGGINSYLGKLGRKQPWAPKKICPKNIKFGTFSCFLPQNLGNSAQF